MWWASAGREGLEDGGSSRWPTLSPSLLLGTYGFLASLWVGLRTYCKGFSPNLTPLLAAGHQLNYPFTSHSTDVTKHSWWELSPYVCLPFSEYIVRIVGTLGEKLEPARFYRPFKFRPEYNKIVELVRNSDYEEIHIYKQDGQIKKVKTVSVKRGQFSTSDLNIELNKSDFQKIEVFKDKGVIVTLKSEENRRL